MDNYYNIGLYGITQDDMTSSQCSAQDFMLTQNSYDLSRYNKDNLQNNNSNTLDIIKEEDIFSQAEQLFFENEKASLQKAMYLEVNQANNANNKANLNKTGNISSNNQNSNSFANDTCTKNGYAQSKPSGNNANAGNSNANNASNNKATNNSFKANSGSSAATNNSSCNNNSSGGSLIDEKIYLISQEIDKIEMQQKEDSLKKLNLAGNISNSNSINSNSNNHNGNGKIKNNLAANKNQPTNGNNNNNNNSSHGVTNNNANKFNNNNSNSSLNPNINNSANLSNNANNHNINNQKANKLKNDLLQADPSLNLKAKADFNTEKKHSAQKNNFSDESLDSLNYASDALAAELNRELFIKIKSASDIFLTEFDAFSNKIHIALENYKQVFLSDVNSLYQILNQETVYIVSEEEKNRLIDEKIKIIFNEMMGVFSQITPKDF